MHQGGWNHSCPNHRDQQLAKLKETEKEKPIHLAAPGQCRGELQSGVGLLWDAEEGVCQMSDQGPPLGGEDYGPQHEDVLHQEIETDLQCLSEAEPHLGAERHQGSEEDRHPWFQLGEGRHQGLEDSRRLHMPDI